MRRDIRRLLTRCAALAAPLVVLLGAYLVQDPFLVLRDHAPYERGWSVPVNRDHVSTDIYLSAPAREYNAFIFGNSRTQAIHAADWSAYLPADARPYHFDASFESLFGIASKLESIEARGDVVRDALILVDSTLLAREDNVQSPLFIKDWRISGQRWVAYQLVFFEAYLANGYFLKYWIHQATGRTAGWMGGVFETHSFRHLPASNDLLYTSQELAIAQDSARYFADRNRFPARGPAAGRPVRPVIHESQRALLRSIATMLARHSSRYVVVVPPGYDERPLAPEDMQALREIFGPARVRDFAGINALTSSEGGYYEASHFRPAIARQMLRELYAGASVTAPPP
ncbi:MAG: hypothetical protein JWO05_1978 [Gemmatimonadetes bacterium]|nr:hypothetical protein [Gemmatimonadota bacterium]